MHKTFDRAHMKKIAKLPRNREVHVIVLSTRAIANYLGISLASYNKRKQRHNLRFRTKDPWEGFWNLVRYLEEQGLRPPAEPAMPALGSKQQETTQQIVKYLGSELKQTNTEEYC